MKFNKRARKREQPSYRGFFQMFKNDYCVACCYISQRRKELVKKHCNNRCDGDRPSPCMELKSKLGIIKPRWQYNITKTPI